MSLSLGDHAFYDAMGWEKVCGPKMSVLIVLKLVYGLFSWRGHPHFFKIKSGDNS